MVNTISVVMNCRPLSRCLVASVSLSTSPGLTLFSSQTTEMPSWLITMSPFSIFNERLSLRFDTIRVALFSARIQCVCVCVGCVCAVCSVYTDERVQELLADLWLADSFLVRDGYWSRYLSRWGGWSCLLCGAFLANGSIRDPGVWQVPVEISSVYLDHTPKD